MSPEERTAAFPLDTPQDAAPTRSRAVRERLVAASAALLCLLAFAEGVGTTLRHWFEPGSPYAHGPLAAAVCLWLLARDRRRIAARPSGGSGWGFLLLGLALWTSWVGGLERAASLQRYALWGGLLGCGVVLCGARRVLAAWSAAAYALAFAIPAPKPLLALATADLQLAVARWTHSLLGLLGRAAVLRGEVIHFSGGRSVAVAELCSGLRSLVTLLALGAFFALLQPSRRRGLGILALSLPLALLANVARTLLLSLLVAGGFDPAPGGWLHEASGLLVYAFALGALLCVHGLLARGRGAPSAEEVVLRSEAGAPQAPRAGSDAAEAADPAVGPSAPAQGEHPGRLVTASGRQQALLLALLALAALGEAGRLLT
ncbi:MAG: exosortase/archaeosortase family protein, partial [Planctomycetota bacterium]